MMFIKPEDYTEALAPYADSLVLCVRKDNYKDHLGLIKESRMVELSYESGIENEFTRLRALKPDLFISVGIPLNTQAADRAVNLTQADADTLHFYADNHGNELDSEMSSVLSVCGRITVSGEAGRPRSAVGEPAHHELDSCLAQPVD